jgi:hypothetical protein
VAHDHAVPSDRRISRSGSKRTSIVIATNSEVKRDRHDDSVLGKLEHIAVAAKPNGRIVAGRKSGLRDLEGALGLIANQIEALR